MIYVINKCLSWHVHNFFEVSNPNKSILGPIGAVAYMVVLGKNRSNLRDAENDKFNTMTGTCKNTLSPSFGFFITSKFTHEVLTLHIGHGLIFSLRIHSIKKNE